MTILFEGELGANGRNDSQLRALLHPFARTFWKSVILKIVVFVLIRVIKNCLFYFLKTALY